MGKIWRLLAPFNIRHNRVLRHIDWALGDQTSLTERHKIARNMWENLGRTFAEALILDKIIRDPSRVQIDTNALTQWIDNEDKAAIFISHHFGNWELNAAPALWHTDRAIMGVYKRVKNKLVENWVKSIRDSMYKGGLYTESDNPARTILQQLRQGVSFAMICDLRDGHGLDVNLFDMPTKVTEKTGDQQQDIETLTQACHTQFEEWIKRHPEQWMWAPYRWKGRYESDDKPLSWAQFIAKSKDDNGVSS